MPNAFRGPLSMILATGSYLVNDTMMKLATSGLPTYEVLFLRGAAATLWGIPLLLLLGYGRQIPLLFDRRVLQRNVFELAIPGDISIVGFDGVGPAGWSSYQLTTIRQPVRRMTQAAVSMLIERIENPGMLAEQRLFGGELVVGRSARLG